MCFSPRTTRDYVPITGSMRRRSSSLAWASSCAENRRITWWTNAAATDGCARFHLVQTALLLPLFLIECALSVGAILVIAWWGYGGANTRFAPTGGAI